MIRRLTSDDFEITAAFLRQHFDSSFILLANMTDAGLVFEGRRYQGVYAGAFENGELAGVVAHYWNGNILFQAPQHAPELARAVRTFTGLPLSGLIGPRDQIVAARTGLGADQAPVNYDKREILYKLTIGQMNVPDVLRTGSATCRYSVEADFSQLVELAVSENSGPLGGADTPEFRARARERIKATSDERLLFVLDVDGIIVAQAFFHGNVDAAVQVGGVFTLPQYRGRGYARSIVAGSLLLAAERGATRGLLFTADDNVPAQRAYESLGFKPVGEYGIILFDK
jgi:uncharacterized protein